MNHRDQVIEYWESEIEKFDKEQRRKDREYYRHVRHVGDSTTLERIAARQMSKRKRPSA